MRGAADICHEVHSISDTGNHHTVGHSIQCTHLIEWDGLIEVVNGDGGDRAEAAIDPSNQLVHVGLQLLVLLHIGTGWDGYLYQHNLTNERRVAVEEQFQRVQLLGDALPQQAQR